MHIDINLLKKNFKFIIGILLLMIVMIIISMFVSDDGNRLPSKDLEADGNSNIHGLVINEIMASNDGALATSGGEVYDWIEIYNGNDYDINLKSYSLTDNENKNRWAFPETTIGAKSYLIVFMSGKNQEG